MEPSEYESALDEETKLSELTAPREKEKVSLSDFLLLSMIGKGTYAKVVLVRKKNTRQVLALKILKKSLLEKKNQKAKLSTERQVLIEMKHPFIIKLHYAFQNERKLFFAMEYCPGGELFNLIQKRRVLNEDQARFYAVQILLALQYLHSKDIIYRDLKPENVMIDKEGFIRLCDFGLSKRGITGNSGATSLCGTPEYLAPEILNRKSHGKPVDWWTFGAILYEMLTGLPPFYTTKRDELFENIKNGKLKYPTRLSISAVDLLDKLFNKDPTKRLGSGPNGAEEIKKHNWFSLVNWDAYLRKEIKPPFIPKISNEIDVSNFNPEFTEAPIENLVDSGQIDNPGLTDSGVLGVERMRTFSDWSYGGESYRQEDFKQ